MAWVKVDDRFSRGPKVTRASFELSGKNARGRVLAVWLDMMSYCNLNTTDGFVPAHEVPTMADADPKSVIKAMSFSDERMGPLVESVEGGWQMRNYAEYQPTRADLEAAKQRTASRQKAWRERKSNSVTPPSRDVVSQVPEPNRSEPNRSGPERTEELAAPPLDDYPTPPEIEAILAIEPIDRTREQGEALAAHRGDTLIPWGQKPQRVRTGVDPSIGLHRGCHGGGVHPCCHRGKALCVPVFLGNEWLDQCAGDLAYVGRFISEVIHGTPEGKPVGDPVKFWRAKWDAAHRQPTERLTKGAQAAAAGRDALALITARQG